MDRPIRHWYLVAAVLALWLLPGPVSAAPVLDLTRLPSDDLRPWLDRLTTTPEVGIDRVRQPHWQRQFTPDATGRLTPGRTTWLRLRLHNPHATTREWWLDPWPLLPERVRGFQLTETGSRILTPRPPPGRLTEPMILRVPPGESTLLLGIDVALPQALSLRLTTRTRALTRLKDQTLWRGLGLGALIILTLSATFFAVLFRDAIYRSLAAYLLLVTGFISAVWYGYLTLTVFLAPGLLLLIQWPRLLLLRRMSPASQSSTWTWAYRGLLAALAITAIALPLFGVSRLLPAVLILTGLCSTYFIAGQAWLALRRTPGALWLALAHLWCPLAILSVLLAHDVTVSRAFLPSTGLLGLIIAEALAMVLVLFLRSARLWLQREAQRRRMATVEAETRSRSDMLGRLSHEVRTPMSGILGMAELLEDTPLTPVQKEYVRTIQGSGQLLLNLVGDVLEASNPALHEETVQAIPFDLETLVNEVIQGFRSRAEQHRVELVCDLPDDLPQIVIGDPLRLRQVLIHVVDHALTLTEQGNILIQLRLQPRGQQCVFAFRVVDSGYGPRASQPAPPAARRALGLSVARALVQRMGGTFQAVPGERGSHEVLFTLTLPVETWQAPMPEHLRALLAGRRLLIVDDNAYCARALAAQAERWGMDVTTAGSGNEALALLRAPQALDDPFDVVLVDYRMPSLNGVELARKIGQILEPPPVVCLLTGVNTPPRPSELEAAGISRVLTKPVTGQMLRLSLAEALQRARRDDRNGSVERPPLRVLLAEDNPVTARVIEAMLQKLDATFHSVTDGRQALEAVQRDHYDLVLMDCEMPVMDGYEATRQIREWERSTGRPPIPIIALTAHILDVYREKSLRAGMNAHLGKPVRLVDLEHALAPYRLPAERRA